MPFNKANMPSKRGVAESRKLNGMARSFQVRGWYWYQEAPTQA